MVVYLVWENASVRKVQWNIDVSDLSTRAACRVDKLHHKQLITLKRDITHMQHKRNKKAKNMCLRPFCTHSKSSCCITYLSYGNKKWLFHQDCLLLRHHHFKWNFHWGWQLRSNLLWDDLLSVMDWLIRWAGFLQLQDPRELEEIVAGFMEMVCLMVTGRNKDYIINMDQLPIRFTFDGQRTLELVGTHTLSISTYRYVIPNGQR